MKGFLVCTGFPSLDDACMCAAGTDPQPGDLDLQRVVLKLTLASAGSPLKQKRKPAQHLQDKSDRRQGSKVNLHLIKAKVEKNSEASRLAGTLAFVSRPHRESDLFQLNVQRQITPNRWCLAGPLW